MHNYKPTVSKKQANSKLTKVMAQQLLLPPTAYGNYPPTVTAVPDAAHVTKADRVAHITKALRLMFRGSRDEEVIGAGQSFLAGTGKYRYLTYSDLLGSIDEQAQWLSESIDPSTTVVLNPLNDTYPRTPTGTSGPCKQGNKDIARLRFLAIDIDRIDKALKDAGAPDADQLKMLEQAKNDMLEALTDLGFKSVMITFSGNGWHLLIPVEFAHTDANAKKLKDYLELLRPHIDPYPQLTLDTAVTTPKTLISLPGTINRKYTRTPSLRWCINIDQLSEAGMDAARQGNTDIIETNLAEQILALPTELQPKAEKVKAKHDPDMEAALIKWDADNLCLPQLLSNGYTKGPVSKKTQGITMSRPGKTLKEGVSLIVGGKADITWNWSTGDEILPDGCVIRPYWMHLLFSKVVNRKGTVINPQAWVDFFTDVRTKYGPPREPGAKVNLITTKTAIVPAPRPLAKPTTGETDTLSSYKPTGIIAAITAHLDRINPMIAGSINKANAIACYSNMIGKSRVGPTGLPCNIYIALLSPSSGGKDSGRSFIQDFNEEIDEAFLIKHSSTDYSKDNLGYTIAAGSGGTMQGMFDQLLLHGSMLILGDESSRFIHPAESDRPEDKMMRDFFLTASSGKAIPGRAKANNESRPKITRPFVSQLHTAQPSTYFAQLQSSNVQKGMIGRFFHAATDWARINRKHDYTAKIPPALITEGVYWRGQNLLGYSEQKARIMGRVGEGAEIPLLGKFCPIQSALKFVDAAFESRWHDYREYCADEHRRHAEKGQEAEGLVWSRMAENALRMAQIYTLSDDHNATIVDPKQFDISTRMMENSCALIRAGIAKGEETAESKLRDRVYLALVNNCEHIEPTPGAPCVSKRELFKKTEHLKGIPRVAQLDIILNDLVQLGKITMREGKCGSVNIYLEP